MPAELEERLQALRAEEINPAVGWMVPLARGAGVIVLQEAETVAAGESGRIDLMELGELVAELLVVIAALPSSIHVSEQQVVAAAAEHLGHGQTGLLQRGKASSLRWEEIV